MTTFNQETFDQFTSLINGGISISGTNQEKRTEIWNALRAAYPTTLTLDIDGAIVTFSAQHSLSGKTTSYTASITRGMYKWLTGHNTGLTKNKEPFISINHGIITIHGGGKYYTKISNNRVIALLK